MNISEKGLNLIKLFEGCRLAAYKCPAGIWTIGWGTTSADKNITGKSIVSGMTISQTTADEWLRISVNAKYTPKVEKYNRVYHFNQNQFDALTSFAYNIGSIDQLTANGTRTIAEISNKLLAYDKAGGKTLAGLTRRRQAEKALFDTPVENSAANPVLVTELKEKAEPKYITKKEVETFLVKRYAKQIESLLNRNVIIDGKISKKLFAVAFETELKKLGADIPIDGIFDKQDKKAFNAFAGYIKRGKKNIFVKLWKCILVWKGCKLTNISCSAGQAFVDETNKLFSKIGTKQDSVVHGSDIMKILY